MAKPTEKVRLQKQELPSLGGDPNDISADPTPLDPTEDVAQVAGVEFCAPGKVGDSKVMIWREGDALAFEDPIAGMRTLNELLTYTQAHSHAISDVGGLQAALNDKVSISATGLGKTGNQTPVTLSDAAGWSSLPVGFSAFIHRTSTGNPIANWGYFTKVANRNIDGGWGGLWVGYSAGQNFIGRALNGSDLPTWDRLWSDANHGVGSGLDADLLDGQHGSYYLDLGNATGNLPTTRLSEPAYVTGNVSKTARPLFDVLRADRTAFLPAEQIIIEQSTDGGVTWVDAQVSNTNKRRLFTGQRPTIGIPLKNGVKSTDCMIRITITGMRYDVPPGTAETSRYNYWNSTYVQSTERYFRAEEGWVWINSNADRIYLKVERATGGSPNTWVLEREAFLSGWSGGNYFSLSGNTFGGSTTQTGNYWNWRFTFRTCTNQNTFDDAGLNPTYLTSPQAIYHLKIHGPNVWVNSNNLMYSDHLYRWDEDQNAHFPAGLTANSLTVNKVDGISRISFPGVSSDAGYIAHIENPSNTATLRISISDDPATNDALEIGAHPSSGWTPSFRFTTDGKMWFGTQGSAWDTNLYRASSNSLRTDDGFVVGGSLSVLGSIAGDIKSNGSGNWYIHTNGGAKTFNICRTGNLDTEQLRFWVEDGKAVQHYHNDENTGVFELRVTNTDTEGANTGAGANESRLYFRSNVTGLDFQVQHGTGPIWNVWHEGNFDPASKADASSLTTHTSDTTAHITAAERAAWNSKASLGSTAPQSVLVQTASAGTSTEAARADHKHNVSVGTPVAIGTVNSAGNATSLARSDHIHAHGTIIAANSHPISAITGLQDALNGKFSTSGGSITGNVAITGDISLTGNIDATGSRIDAFDAHFEEMYARSFRSAYPVNSTDTAFQFYTGPHLGKLFSINMNGVEKFYIDNNGDAWANGVKLGAGGSYTLPAASTDTRGGIKIGDGLVITGWPDVVSVSSEIIERSRSLFTLNVGNGSFEWMPQNSGEELFNMELHRFKVDLTNALMVRMSMILVYSENQEGELVLEGSIDGGHNWGSLDGGATGYMGQGGPAIMTIVGGPSSEYQMRGGRDDHLTSGWTRLDSNYMHDEVWLRIVYYGQPQKLEFGSISAEATYYYR